MATAEETVVAATVVAATTVATAVPVRTTVATVTEAMPPATVTATKMTDSVTANGEFDGEDPLTITFTYDEHNNVVWTENGESTVMEYSYRTDDY